MPIKIKKLFLGVICLMMGSQAFALSNNSGRIVLHITTAGTGSGYRDAKMPVSINVDHIIEDVTSVTGHHNFRVKDVTGAMIGSTSVLTGTTVVVTNTNDNARCKTNRSI